MLKRLLQGEGNGDFVVAWRGADIVRLARLVWGGQCGKGEEVGEGRGSNHARYLSNRVWDLQRTATTSPKNGHG